MTTRSLEWLNVSLNLCVTVWREVVLESWISKYVYYEKDCPPTCRNVLGTQLLLTHVTVIAISYQNLIISFHVDLWLMSSESSNAAECCSNLHSESHWCSIHTRWHGQTQSARSPRIWPHGPQCNLVALFWCVWSSRCLMWLGVNSCIHWLHHAMVSMSFFSKFLILKGPNSFQTWAKNAIRLFFSGVSFWGCIQENMENWAGKMEENIDPIKPTKSWNELPFPIHRMYL